MQTAKELFVHQLTDMLDAEQKLVEALGKMAEDHSDNLGLEEGEEEESRPARRSPASAKKSRSGKAA